MFSDLKKRPFEEQDVYNPQNVLRGEIVIDQGKYYGTLILTHVNGVKCEEQVILSAPKMYYPYNKTGKFFLQNLPSLSNAYEKYDGTAIICYAYEAEGKVYKTFKTRLTPIIRSSDLWDFNTMWREMLQKYPSIWDLASMDKTVVCELYGIRNKHLIIYDTSLDTVLLFGIDRKTESIILPEDIEHRDSIKTAEIRYAIPSSSDFPAVYESIREAVESKNQTTEEGILGSEGVMIYIKTDNGWKPFKCKPPSVMEVHCAPGLKKKDIIATVYNAFENYDERNITYETVKELLMEEVTEREVEARKDVVEKCIEFVKEDVKFRNIILTEYSKFGITIHDDKRVVMRHMSDVFGKGRIKYIYNILSGMK